MTFHFDADVRKSENSVNIIHRHFVAETAEKYYKQEMLFAVVCQPTILLILCRPPLDSRRRLKAGLR